MMNNYIEYQNLVKLLRYAGIYGLANQREDILAQCSILYRKAGRGGSGMQVMLSEEDGRTLGKMFPYALATVGSADGGAGADMCRIVQEHTCLMMQYDRTSAMTVADMMKDMRQGKKVHFISFLAF